MSLLLQLLVAPRTNDSEIPYTCGSRLDLWFHLRPWGYKKQESKFGEFPWLVAIYAGEDYLCSGALITSLALLTAAHCVQGRNATELRVVAG